MEELKEIETTAEELNENTEIAEPVAENDGLVEESDGTGFGELTAGALAIAGAIWLAKSAWKYVLKPGYQWTKTRIEERKAKKAEKEVDAEAKTEENNSEEK